MKNQPFNPSGESKKIGYSKVDVIKLDTKCLYAGKLERIKQWKEQSHSHPFCEIMFVLSGGGQVHLGEKAYDIKKGDIIVYNPNVVHSESSSGESGLELAFFGITNFKIGNLPFDYMLESGACPVLRSGKDDGKFEF